MSFVFTTTPEALELALLETLREALGAQVYSVETWEGDVADAFAAGRPMRLPAVLVSYQGGPFEPQGGDHYVQHAEVHVLVLAGNRRGEAAARRPEADGEVGTYGLLALVMAALTRNDLELDGVGELIPLQLEPLQTGKGRDALGSAWLLPFRVELDFADVEPEQELMELTTTYQDPDERPLAEETIVITEEEP